MLTLGKKVLSVPILQGGMGVGVSLGGLAGAVAACGGMGCISTADAGYREPDFARDPASANHRALTAEIRKAKQIANGAGMVAINAMVATQDYAALQDGDGQSLFAEGQHSSFSAAMRCLPLFHRSSRMSATGRTSWSIPAT